MWCDRCGYGSENCTIARKCPNCQSELTCSRPPYGKMVAKDAKANEKRKKGDRDEREG